MLPNAWIIGQVDLLKRFLNCMNLSYIPMLATIVTTITHVVILIVMVVNFDMGIFGIVLANTLTNAG
jgi:hypothetical protein